MLNGKYYAIPNADSSGTPDCANVISGMLVGQNWLDKLGLKAPTTINEFTLYY